jgi:sec-independent protein translocase protein TatA
MPSLGLPEVIFIFLIILILFGSSRIGGIGKGLGEGIRNFKQGMKGDDAPRRTERIDDKTDTRKT